MTAGTTPGTPAARPSIAVCFFGITRSLAHTLPSIEAHVLGPARRHGSVRVYAHFFRQQAIDNPRSGETGRLDPDEHRLLAPDWLRLEAPDQCLQQWDFEAIKRYGDFWNDEFRSLRNLVHQLHSLHEVTQAVLADGADLCLFCRPDLRYHDSLDRPIRRGLRATGPLAQVPYWQPWMALNDRFALLSGAAATAAYGLRIRRALAFCAAGPRPLHSEPLVKHALAAAAIPVHTIPSRASRVRLDGREAEEDFEHPRARILRERYGVRMDAVLRWAKG